MNGYFELVQTVMEEEGSLFFSFLHSLTGVISETLEIKIKMGIESEGWDWKSVEIESCRIEI